ncbi:MAG: O-antigen polysaccharide polymerase Wzy [Syntrophaceae bacterium]|nr:O-antigen polysaccharide polymerase Wzy [Syntrophaceae bacterium]
MNNIKTISVNRTNFSILKDIILAMQKSQMIVPLIFWVISLFLYFYAPNAYSYQYCFLILMVYLISSIWIIRRTVINNNYFNFHILFLISFFFVNFVYPIFLYPILPTYFAVFKFSFNEDVITKATSLALIGSSSYILGVSFQLKEKLNSPVKLQKNLNALQFIMPFFAYGVFVMLLCFAGTAMLGGRFGSSENIPPGLLVIFQAGIGLSVILSINKKNKGTILNFIRNFNKPILVLLLLYILLFLYVGDRGPAIQIALIAICSFSLFVRPIKMKKFFIMVLVGMLALSFIGAARSKNINASESGVTNFMSRGKENIQFGSFFNIGMDLIVNNRNLYVGYDYANQKGLNYGRGMVRYIFAPIPGMPGLMTGLLFDATPQELSSGRFFTDEANTSWGLGTNIIADLYMEWGLLGVIFFMFLLGYIVMKLHIKAVNKQNYAFIIGYIFLVGFSIYLPRATLFEPLRHVIWAISIFYLFKYFANKLFPTKKAAVFES